MNLRASEIIDPQLACGGWTPSPRKDRLASYMISEGMFMVATTMMVDRQLGMRWRKIICILRPPLARAANS